MQRFTISIPGSAGTLRVYGGISSGQFGAGTVSTLAAQDSIRATFTDEQALALAAQLIAKVQESFDVEAALEQLGIDPNVNADGGPEEPFGRCQ